MIGRKNSKSPAAADNAPDVVIVIEMGCDHRSITYPNPRRDVAVKQGHRVVSEERRHDVRNVHRLQCDRGRLRSLSEGHKGVQCGADRNLSRLEIETFKIVGIEEAAVDLRWTDHRIDRAPGVESLDVVDRTRLRLTACLNGGPVSKQASQHGRPVRGKDLVLEHRPIHTLPISDFLQSCPLYPQTQVARSRFYP